MRKLVYNCIKDGKVIKTVNTLKEAFAWEEEQGGEFKEELIEINSLKEAVE